jgi:hypothetical protein
VFDTDGGLTILIYIEALYQNEMDHFLL